MKQLQNSSTILLSVLLAVWLVAMAVGSLHLAVVNPAVSWDGLDYWLPKTLETAVERESRDVSFFEVSVNRDTLHPGAIPTLLSYFPPFTPYVYMLLYVVLTVTIARVAIGSGLD